MKTAAEYLDEAEAKAKDYHAMNYIYGSPCPTLPILLRQYRIAAIAAALGEAYEHGFNVASGYEMTRTAAAVAEERARWREWLDRMQKMQELDIEEDFDPAPDKRD